MAARYAGRVDFVFVYTREAHPGERYPAHRSFEQKLAHARAMVERWSIRRPMLVDDLEGTVHRAYGALPNMSWVIDRRGRVAYKASWTDARTVEIAVEQVLWEEAQRQAGRDLSGYRIEMVAHRVQDRPAFLAGLLEAGPRAVEEFIAAIRHSAGEGPARPLQAWWEAHRPED